MHTLSVGPAASDPLWIQMLTIFVPALAALIVAVLGQAWAAAAARAAQERAAWRALQQSTLLDAQDQLMTWWLATAKILRGSADRELQFTLQDANARLTVLGSRLADRQLADDLAVWQQEMNVAVKKVTQGAPPLSPSQVNELHLRFVALSDRLGTSAVAPRLRRDGRELSGT